MKPVFKDIVCIGAMVAESTAALFLHGWTGNSSVGVNLRVSAASFFLRMSKGALCPVMHKAFNAWYNLQKKEKTKNNN